MKLVYHRDWRGNFGDDLNPAFFGHVCPGYEHAHPELLLFGIGTLLNDVHGPIMSAVIFGSGFGYGESIRLDPTTTKVIGVRGPITAAKLGLDPAKYVIGDPALFLEHVPAFNGGADLAQGRAVVAVHHRTAELWEFQSDDEFFYLDPGTTPVADYVATIRNARVVYAEAMHAAIAACALDVPFFPISIRGGLERTKWLDFLNSVGIPDLRFTSLGAPSLPLRRRAAVSSFGQKWAAFTRREIGLSGRSVSEVERVRTTLALKRISSDYVCRADVRRVHQLQEKMATAIRTLNALLSE